MPTIRTTGTIRAWGTVLLSVAVYLAIAAGAAAQGVQTGTLTGTVKSQDDLVVPDVIVTVKSPALQGERSTLTDENGVYLFRGLPPGDYSVTFEKSGMSVAKDTTVVPLGGTSRVDATLVPASVQETVNVVAEAPSPLVTPTTSVNFRAQEVNVIPVGRTPALIAELAPGLTDNTPNVGQVTISGAFAYDNVFLIDGVDVNDNLFATANGVYIEDAIQETQILTSGISAEYGRFSGGVINVITKTGGNIFTGSIRTNLTNTAWTDETPWEDSNGTKRADKLSKSYEGTLGGPILRDRLWFFAAGRSEKSQTAMTLLEIGTPYNQGIDNKRGEIKFTGRAGLAQTIQGSFVKNSTEDSNRAGIANAVVDLASLVTRQTPNRLFVLGYNGVLGNRFFASMQYSEKKFGFRNSGGTSEALKDSPFRTRGAPGTGIPSGRLYNAPFFSSFDPENRNNRQVSGSLGYFLSGKSGSHDLKVGFEDYTSTRTGGNSQSATGYVFLSDYVTDGAGKPVLDSAGHPVPRFVPGVSRVQNWIATKGAQIDINTISFYVQDHWRAGDRWAFDIGVRGEKVKSTATGDIVGANTHAVVPRLGAAFDPMGDGKIVIQASYAHYSGKYSEAQFARNTNVGTPSNVTRGYTGPAGTGMSFAPGLDLNNYTTLVAGSFGTATVFLDGDLASPVDKEWTLSIGRDLGRGGYAKMVYTNRHVTQFIEDFLTREIGSIDVVANGIAFGRFDKTLYKNTDEPIRRYQGLQFLGRQRVTDRLNVNGHWTVQLKNEGNFEGEATNQPGNPSLLGDYPDVFIADRNFPVGRINDFQKHKIRLWAVYNQDLGKLGTLDVAPIWRYNSGLTYSLGATAVPLSTVQLSHSSGYANINTATTQTLFFDKRGSEDFKGYGVMDLSLSYGIPVWRSVKPWVKLDFYNLFNNQKQIGWDTTVTPDPNSPRDANGLLTGYIKGTRFGQATRNEDFVPPISGQSGGRRFQMAFGLRF